VTRGPAFHRSIFARLVAVMLAMAACLLAMVFGFYYVIIIPGIHHSLDQLVGRHARAIAESRPTPETARALADQLDLQVRFVGADTTWTTDPNVPTLAALGQVGHHGNVLARFFVPRHAYYMVVTPRGRYIFARTFGAHFAHAHAQMLVMLLLSMAGVFATAYWVMRRALRPVRLLTDGVTQIGEGRLDVTVENRSRDEFGTLTDAFNTMARRVRDLVRSRDQLLLDVSHELRSPLTRLKVALELAPDEARRRAMRADVAEMETMVTELLELERLRGGKGILAERRDLVPLLRDVTERHADRPPGVRLRLPGDARPVTLDLDADRVRIVLRNLVENAIKFSLADSGPVEITLEDRADAVVVRVSDDGPGVPEGEARALFEPFFRLDPSRSKKTGGYGLGLSMCKRIMEAHGGTISVERRAPRGATFTLTFPRRG
jgi:signal transduction histidine kinase